MAEPEAAPSWSIPQNEDTLRTTIPDAEVEPGRLPPFVPVIDTHRYRQAEDFEPVENPLRTRAIDYSARPAYRGGLTEHEEALFVSAPVSRGPIGEYNAPPDRIRLSKEEMEICKGSNVDPVDYARGKVELAKQKKLGLRQNG
jgi:hypothetical protein